MTEKKSEEKPEEKTEEKPVDETGAMDRLKKLFNEVLDERETKAAAAKEKPEEQPEEKRTAPKRSFMQELFGG